MLLLRASLVALALAAALAAGGATALVRARHARVRVLARAASDYRLDEPEGAESVARSALDAAENARCAQVSFESNWRLPPQEGLPGGATLSFAAFDGHPSCEAARQDPAVLVIGDDRRARSALRLPDNTKPPEVQVLDGGGRLVIVVQGCVWRGERYCLAAAWDKDSGALEKMLETTKAVAIDGTGGLEGLHLETVADRR